jgi:hypothetical protein
MGSILERGGNHLPGMKREPAGKAASVEFGNAEWHEKRAFGRNERSKAEILTKTISGGKGSMLPNSIIAKVRGSVVV